MRIDAFIDPDEYKREVQGLVEWVKSSPTAPGVERIYVPGEIEETIRQRRQTEGIKLEEMVWAQFVTHANELSVTLPA